MTSTGQSTPVADASLAANVKRGHKLGWSFTPLRGKVPTLKGWQDRPREDLPEALDWAARGNVGLRTGHSSGIVVIDSDPGADISQLDLPRTVTVNTGREGGRHYYFRCDEPLGNSSGKLGRHVDVKADGGQVVFPGSTHPETHRRYEWAQGLAPWDIEITDLPADVLSRLRGADRRASPSSAAVTPPRPAGSPYAAAALERELRAVCAAQQGARNATLNAAAFSIGTLVGAGLLDEEAVQQQLCQAGESTGLGATEVAKTVRSGLDAGIEQPRQVPQPTGKRRPAAEGVTAGYDLYGNAGRFMRQDYFQFRRTHKTVLVTNNKPVITETSNAIWRRLRLIPFTVTIPPDKQDKHLTDKLVTEWPGILAWAVKGCLDWQRRQCDLALPQTVTAATEEYRSDSDPVGQFIEERCLVTADVKVSRAGLYQAYEQWARSSGEMILDGKAFAGRMRAHGFDASLWMTEGGKRCRAWGGLALVGPSEEVPGQWD